MRASRSGAHISGAEGLFSEGQVKDALESYYMRAVQHERGKPDSIVLSAERLSTRPASITSLSLSTIRCSTPRQALASCKRVLQAAGVSAEALSMAFRVLRGPRVMRGAALISASGARRLEPDRKRGVRTSRLGLSGAASRELQKRLAALGINTPTVREALMLASKALSCPAVLAEICVSDDPGYSTGYVATRQSGYVRVTNIKRRGDTRGGRVYFISDGASVEGVIDYLQSKPVLVTEISDVSGGAS